MSAQIIRFVTTIPATIEYINDITSLRPRTVLALEETLRMMFDFSQGMCPVDTGSLRNSGKTESDTDGEVWTGQMSYGGSSPGYPNDPVDYTYYVMAYYGELNWWNVSIDLFENQFEFAAGRNFS